MSILMCLIKACFIGFIIAAPVGPVGILCIRRTLEVGLRGAIAVGLGAALADSIYGLIAALGLTIVSDILIENTLYIKFFGGIFLIYLAYKEIKSKTGQLNEEKKTSEKIWSIIPSVFLLTLTNPMTILSFIGIFASIGGDFISVSEPFMMVLGVFLGSMMWWLILGGIVLKIKQKLPDSLIQRIRYFSAFVLGAFGIFSILGSFGLFRF